MTNSLKETKVSKFTQEEMDYINHSISIKEIAFVLKILPRLHLKKKKNPSFTGNFILHLKRKW